MITLGENETREYVGGVKLSYGLAVVITTVATFILGFFNGYTSKPNACYKR